MEPFRLDDDGGVFLLPLSVRGVTAEEAEEESNSSVTIAERGVLSVPNTLAADRGVLRPEVWPLVLSTVSFNSSSDLSSTLSSMTFKFLI